MAHNAVKMTVDEVERALDTAQGRTVLLFTSSNCPNCPAAIAALDRAEARKAFARSLRIDAEASLELVDYAGVLALPTLQVFDGSKLVSVTTGNRVPRALDQL